ncbi:DUF2318 domain-containing protein [bacterium]|nr:MAG: DUF2318 domain-containing protein [bacterium]
MSNDIKKDKFAEKRAAVEGKSSGSLKLFVIGAAVVALAVASLVAYSRTGDKSGEAAKVQAATPVNESGVVVSFPLADFEGGQAKFYEHKTADSITVRYFIVKSDDGVTRAAFDACDACWPHGKGYSQDKKEMVCNNCQMRFPTSKINEVKGGCNPSPLARTVENGQLLIKVSDIEAGKSYFNLKK